MAEHDSGVDSERQALLEHLQRHRVEGIVIGGVAIQTHRPAYRTDDVDFAPATDPANLRRLAAALNALDLELVVSRRAPRTTVVLPHDYFTPCSLMNQPFWNLATVFGDLDICFVAAGFPAGYEDLRPRATVQAVARTSIALPVASLADVEHSKRTVGREKDLDYFERFGTAAPPAGPTAGPPT